MNFIDYLLSINNISKHSLQALEKNIKSQQYKRKEVILEPNNLSKKIFFIEEGIIRVFYSTENKEITLYFGEENNVSVPVESIFYNQRCKFGIQAITDTKITQLDYSIWKSISSDNFEFQQLQQQTLLNNLKRFTDYIYNTNFKTPKERYDELMTTNPLLFNKVPLGYIASYLGITQETLSRLRSMK